MRTAARVCAVCFWTHTGALSQRCCPDALGCVKATLANASSIRERPQDSRMHPERHAQSESAHMNFMAPDKIKKNSQ